MKTILLIVIVLVVSCKNNSSSNSPDDSLRGDISRDQLISADSVLHWKDRIEKLDSMIVKTIGPPDKLRSEISDIPGKSAEGGELEKLYSANDLVAVIIKYYGETGNKATKYFLINKKILMMREDEEYYSKPIYIQGSKVDSSVSNFFYLINNRWIKLNVQRQIMYDGSYLQRVADLLNDYNEEINDK